MVNQDQVDRLKVLRARYGAYNIFYAQHKSCFNTGDESESLSITGVKELCDAKHVVELVHSEHSRLCGAFSTSWNDDITELCKRIPSMYPVWEQHRDDILHPLTRIL